MSRRADMGRPPFQRHRSWRPWRVALTAAAAGALTLFLCVSGYALSLIWSNNFHEVVAGELYRSGQPSPAMLADVAARTGIRTVLNLRGENAGSAWYRDEVAEAARLGITMIDFRMKASRGLTKAQSAELIAIMEKAQKPILIHCQSGVDRTGLAAALYLAAVEKAGEAAAEHQLSLRYGHLSLALFAGYAMDRSFERMEPSLGFPDS